MKPEIKKCILCKNEIAEKDDYMKFLFFMKGKHEEDKDSFAHILCFRERVNVKTLALDMAKKAYALMDKIGISS